MKMSLILCLLGSVFFTKLASAEVSDRHLENKVIKCAMKIAESRQLNPAIAKGLVELFQTQLNGESLDRCKALAKATQKLDAVENETIKLFFADDSSADEHTRNVSETLKLAAINDLECKVVGAEVDIQVLLGLGLGANVGICIAHSGKRYAIAAPEIVIGLGLGAYAIVDYTEFTIERDESFHAGDEDNLDIIVGTGYAQSATIRSRDDAETIGYGVGLGVGLKTSFHIALKLIPMGRTYKHVRKTLLLGQMDQVTQSLF